MRAENFEAVLEAMLSRNPFQPFTVELHGGTRFEVDHPRVVYREGAAIFVAPGFVPVYFDHESVIQIIDSPAHSAPGRRRSKP